MHQTSGNGLVFLVLSILLSLLAGTAKAQGNATFEQGIAAFEAREWATAQSIFTDLIESEPDNHAVAAYLGRIALDWMPNRNYKQAAKWLERAIEGDEGHADYHYWLGSAYGGLAREAGVPGGLFHARRMKKECERAIECDPSHANARYRLVEYFLEVPGMFGGSTRKARKIAEELKTIDRRLGSQALILVFRAEEEHDAIVDEYRELITLYPEDSDYQTDLANYLIRLSRYPEAFTVCDEAIQNFPDNPYPRFIYGQISAISGQRCEQGIQHLQDYLGIERMRWYPSHGSAHYQLGRIYEQMGRTEQAIAEYEATLRENPSNQRAIDALERLRPPPGCS